MSKNKLRLKIALLTSLAALTIGCQDRGESIVSLPNGFRLVTGSVVSIEDAVPVDGGVTLTLRLSDDLTIKLYLESFFTVTPPPPERWEVYEQLRTLAAGDIARLVVEEKDNRMWIRKVEKL